MFIKPSVHIFYSKNPHFPQWFCKLIGGLHVILGFVFFSFSHMVLVCPWINVQKNKHGNKCLLKSINQNLLLSNYQHPYFTSIHCKGKMGFISIKIMLTIGFCSYKKNKHEHPSESTKYHSVTQSKTTIIIAVTLTLR